MKQLLNHYAGALFVVVLLLTRLHSLQAAAASSATNSVKQSLGSRVSSALQDIRSVEDFRSFSKEHRDRYFPTVPITERRQMNILLPAQELELGKRAFAHAKVGMSTDANPESWARVARVGRALAGIANRPEFEWEFVVLDSPQINAFCCPGGKIAIYTGMLTFTGKNEAALATVLSHEVAHAVARHSGESLSSTIVLNSGLRSVDFLTKLYKADSVATDHLRKGLEVSANVLLTLPHSRSMESEADHIGLIYLARAGYDPEAAVRFWKRMASSSDENPKGVGWLLSTHPPDLKRVEQLQKHMPEAKKEYAAARARLLQKQ